MRGIGMVAKGQRTLQGCSEERPAPLRQGGQRTEKQNGRPARQRVG